MRERILIVDDERTNVLVLEGLLAHAGYGEQRSTTVASEAPQIFRDFRPDLVLLDLHMPELDGLELLRQLTSLVPTDTYLPFIVLTADNTPEAKHRALSSGAHDFITKPFDHVEVLLRIGTHLEARSLHLQLASHAELLERRVRQRTKDLDEARLETLECLARVAEMRDDETGRHTIRVGEMSAILAEAVGLDVDECELIRRAAPLHDTGKIGIPDAVLLKPGKLTDDEFEVVKSHATLGVKILEGTRSPVLHLAREIALTHHERWDGSGYPAGLSGEQIPLSGRIVALADVFDALTHERPYKRAWPVEAAVTEIQDQSGRQFDPAVVEAMLQTLPAFSRAVRVDLGQAIAS
jgi:putative two-component system response regulator